MAPRSKYPTRDVVGPHFADGGVHAGRTVETCDSIRQDNDTYTI